ncbi:MAG: acetyl-CoA carboxylase biotin carboxyl carrier protein subunit [Hyphomicrobiales bacterium]|nr:acetyl-CoA carboxylase biotin carboxyl carrier protein subunit [Hyphomicrobiales bacterium]
MMVRTFRVTVDGTPYEVTVEETTEGTDRLYPDRGGMGRPARRTAVPDAPPPAAAPSAPKPAAAAVAGDEVSPLAGVVHEIHVTVGQEVAEGDRLVTIEAMKMKSGVICHGNGKVSKIHIQAGQAVEAGQVLISIA